jgi:CRISPR-associated endoribonuclease Cas6
MLDELSKLRFGRFRFQLKAATPLRLPPYKGSTLRGGFGIAFKDAVCVVAHRDCERCILRSKCAYPYIFETPVPSGSRRMASLEHAPHPFVIEQPLDRRMHYAAGDAFDFDLVLVGRAIDYLPYFIFAFEQLGARRGIGRGEGEGGRGKFTVEGVTALNGSNGGSRAYDGQSKTLTNGVRAQTIHDVIAPAAVQDFPRPLGEEKGEGALPPAASRLTVSFLTPTRLIFDRALATVPEFHIIIRNLLRRLSNLTYFHCDGELDLDFRGLVEAAEEVKLVEDRTRWHDWERYSARQDEKLKMGGVVGEAVYEGGVSPFIPLLALGEVLHVGKGTGLGLGRVRIVRVQRQ